MFKKRSVKNNTSKRVKLEDDEKVISELADVTEVLVKGNVKDDKIDEADIVDKNQSDDEKLLDTVPQPDDTTTKHLFNADAIVDDQHNMLKEKTDTLAKSNRLQMKDSDGNKIYTGQISTRSKKEVLVKPVSTNVKQNFVLDFQRDVCKDFLKNGYCGFGDTCKFLHYREESKRTAPVEKDWEIAAKRRRKY